MASRPKPHTTLHNYKVFPPDEDPEGTFSSRIVQAEPDDDEPEVPGFPGCKAVPKQVSKDYMDLYRDSSKHNILHRGMMRFLSTEELQLDEVRGCRNGFLSDPTVGSLRPAYKLPLLQQLAHVLRLSGVVDLLEPRSFSPSTHEARPVRVRGLRGRAQVRHACGHQVRARHVARGLQPPRKDVADRPVCLMWLQPRG